MIELTLTLTELQGLTPELLEQCEANLGELIQSLDILIDSGITKLSFGCNFFVDLGDL